MIDDDEEDEVFEPVDILVVDDRPSNVKVVRATLERPGYRIVAASSGPDALAKVLRHDFAVIILDVAMPQMDGFETAAIIREREQSKRIPIVFVTASVYDMFPIFEGMGEGAVDFLRKPVDPNVLRSKVEVFVELHRQRARVERQRARTRELARSMRALEDLLASTAEELKARVAVLRKETGGLVDALERAEPRPAKGALALDRAMTGVEEVADRLLDAARGRMGDRTISGAIEESGP